LLPWFQKEGFSWPKDKPLTCHSFRCGIESYLMNDCKIDRFYIARQGGWAINELAGELLLRYDRAQTIASRIICQTLNSALDGTFVPNEEKKTPEKERKSEKEPPKVEMETFIENEHELKQNDFNVDIAVQQLGKVMENYTNIMTYYLNSKNKH
jgi:hypothetical protein